MAHWEPSAGACRSRPPSAGEHSASPDRKRPARVAPETDSASPSASRSTPLYGGRDARDSRRPPCLAAPAEPPPPEAAVSACASSALKSVFPACPFSSLCVRDEGAAPAPSEVGCASTPLLGNPDLGAEGALNADGRAGASYPPRLTSSPSWHALLAARAESVGARDADGDDANTDFILFRFFIIAKILVAILCAVLAVSVATHLAAVGETLKILLGKIQALGPYSPVAFVVAYVLLVMVLVPAEVLNVAGGLIFVRLYGYLVGLPLAVCSSMAALLLSGVFCFLLSRHVFAKRIDAFFAGSDVYYAFQLAVEEGGTFFVALIRLSPVLPYSVTSYLFGLTALSVPQLVVGSLSSAPLVFVFNCVGAALRDIDEIDFGHFRLSWEKTAMALFGLATAGASIFYISYLTRRKLEQATEALAMRGPVRGPLRLVSPSVVVRIEDERGQN
ncbi:SNARE associated protein [Besnoitia besnoiti]|uniref:SNARE associated protein n=1 Tax=Besnoitia besnoiti TaxID=94643 RepID=A0A2A9M2V2_BESBE|nr:SNARE associated protein [Besnoitia besnoiti]PFH32269.1 SNARE associated protein [Besnoitia besnoiti]